jgi:uncharacterized protein
MSKPTRRGLLTGGLGISIALLFQQEARAEGGLQPDPAGILDLPQGFTYEVLERTGDKMSDGYLVPGRPDGMGVFEVDGRWVLMRNHEIWPDPKGGNELGKKLPKLAYDKRAQGGVTRLVLDPKDSSRISSNLVLAGTYANCCGGVSPWGWFSCEEYFSKGHGFVFLCDPKAATVQRPVRIDAYGRFFHEAVAMEPVTNVAYLTEDQEDAALYRFLPTHPNNPYEGKLQALMVVGQPEYDTGILSMGTTVLTQWIDIGDPLPEEDTLRLSARGRGAAIIRRGEGAAWHDNHLYFSATAGGPNKTGQVLRLNTTTGSLEAIAVSEDTSELEMPDNLTVASWGTVFIAEDGKAGDDYLRALLADGRVLPVARRPNANSEFAGVCMSPDGKTMFCNLQQAGLTIAIRGPFQERFT